MENAAAESQFERKKSDLLAQINDVSGNAIETH
jgi:hypothetical protein